MTYFKRPHKLLNIQTNPKIVMKFHNICSLLRNNGKNRIAFLGTA
jgi:hypothetical protein